jgi:hypothetical protein
VWPSRSGQVVGRCGELCVSLSACRQQSVPFAAAHCQLSSSAKAHMQLSGRGAALLLALAMATVGPRKSTAQQSSATACIFDFDGNGLVGTDDLLWLLAAFGREAFDTRFDAAPDTNGDGVVNAPDLLGLLDLLRDLLRGIREWFIEELFTHALRRR